MKIGYVMNSYPMPSTTFIGREIAELEKQGWSIRRYAIRPWDGELVDPNDQAEKRKTRYLLTGSRSALLGSALREISTNPLGVLRALGLWWQLLAAGGGLIRHAAYFLEAMALRRDARAQGITHLHAHFSSNSAAIAMLSRAMGGPRFSFTVHGPDEFFRPYSNSLGLKIAHAERIVAISHFCRSQLMFFSDPACWDRIAIVHCGVNPDDYGRRRPRSFGKHVVFVGRLDPVKGTPLLVEAFAAAHASHPDARLTVVGDGPARAGLEAQVRKLGLGDVVTFAGFRSQGEVTEILDDADMLVLPSFAEGVPVVLMEAMASRIPVIASRVAGVSELVEDGISGHLVAPGDVAALAARLEALMSDPDLCSGMGAAGRAMVEAEFHIAHEVRWLSQVLSGKAPKGQLRPGAGTSC